MHHQPSLLQSHSPKVFAFQQPTYFQINSPSTCFAALVILVVVQILVYCKMYLGAVTQLIECLPSKEKELDSISMVQWHMLEILALGRWREEDQEFKVIFGYTVS